MMFACDERYLNGNHVPKYANKSTEKNPQNKTNKNHQNYFRDIEMNFCV